MLKGFVLTTVKKNVMEGVYDTDLDKQPNKKNQVKDKEQEEEDSQNEEEQEDQEKKIRKMRKFPYVTDLAEWKHKNKLFEGQKVFIVTGGYLELKKALRERGWVQNPDVNSPCFDLKFTLQGKEIQYDKLHEFQMVNHFQKNGVITTKIGLTKSLKNLKWINDTSQDNFYPKCFDLNDEDDYYGFKLHFKICKALSILKIYINICTKQKKQQQQQQQLNNKMFQKLKIRTQVALKVCQKNIQDIDNIIDKKKIPQIITDKQWLILSTDQLDIQGLAKRKHNDWLKLVNLKYNKNNIKKIIKKNKKKKKNNQCNNNNNNQEQQQQQNNNNNIDNQLLEQVYEMLQNYKNKYPQYHITGYDNIWILKPAGLSRGRGIICYKNLVEIQDHVKSKQSLWIAQKYIQNPLVVHRRKFDIRQWVLVTNFNPLTIWFYNQSYIRFSVIDYDAKQINNKLIHLTNNTISSKNKKYDNLAIKGNMFFIQEFKQYLKNKQSYDVFEQKIKPQMKNIIKQSLMCAIDGIENRKNSYQIYGYDFMVDQNYKVWLIQINSSPSMDYSTHVTSKLVKQLLHDIIKVTVDYASVSKKNKKQINTGQFIKIYKGIEIPQKHITTGINLCLQGTSLIKKKKSNNIRIQSINFKKQN